MARTAFEQGLSDQYQGELIGELLFSELTKAFEDSEHRYKLATLLQLESETAARLRPAVVELGLDLFFQDESRRTGEEFVEGCQGLHWKALMSHLDALVDPYVERYLEIAEIAPREYRDLARSMVVHEQAVQTFHRLEASGDSDRSLDGVIQQLEFPLRRERWQPSVG